MVENISKTIVFLPSFPLNMLPWDREVKFQVLFELVDFNYIRSLLKMFKERKVDFKIISYIRHRPTCEIIEKELAGYTILYKAGQYFFNYRDMVFIVTLKTRPPIPGVDVAVTPRDLLVVKVSVL